MERQTDRHRDRIERKRGSGFVYYYTYMTFLYAYTILFRFPSVYYCVFSYFLITLVR